MQLLAAECLVNIFHDRQTGRSALMIHLDPSRNHWKYNDLKIYTSIDWFSDELEIYSYLQLNVQ